MSYSLKTSYYRNSRLIMHRLIHNIKAALFLSNCKVKQSNIEKQVSISESVMFNSIDDFQISTREYYHDFMAVEAVKLPNYQELLERHNSENLYYDSLIASLRLRVRDEIILNNQTLQSRRFKIVDRDCISLIHIEFHEHIKLHVTLSSSDIHVLPSDLKFFSSIPADIVLLLEEIGYNVTNRSVELLLTINNLHIYKANDDV